MMFRLTAACLVSVTALTAAQDAPPKATFYRDVLPVLQTQCQECHRSGAVAPMPFTTYRETRPWARAIRESILSRKMPPWFADPALSGHFANERRLTPEQIATLTAWVDGGASEGDAKDKPPAARFAEGWSIGQPDMVVEFPREVSVPSTQFLKMVRSSSPPPPSASGDIEEHVLLVKVAFPRDVWVKAAEIHPGNPKAVHHMKVWIRPPGSEWMRDAKAGELLDPSDSQFAMAASAYGPGRKPRAVNDILATYNPGGNPRDLVVEGAAKFIAAGSDLIFDIHYSALTTDETDRSQVGIVFEKNPPFRRLVTTTSIANTNFTIPARATDYEVRAESVLQTETLLVWVQPHMHLRARDYELRAHFPDGASQTLVKGGFDFNWQQSYVFAKPVTLPKGTRLETVAHFDNSANNPFNPKPDADVKYGPLTSDEMAVSYLGFIIGANDDPARIFAGPASVGEVKR